MKLTDTKLRSLKTPGKHFDGHGLYLEVTQAGGRYWRMKYRHLGKENRLAFGVYPTVSLKDARDKAAQAREQLAKGENPAAQRDTSKAQALDDAANTLQAVTALWLEHQSTAWTAITRERIAASLEQNILKPLGSRALSSLTPKDIKQAVKVIEARGAGDQAARVLSRVKAIFRWAVVHERLAHNPMLDLVPGEILKPREVTHRAALSDRDLPEFLSKFKAYGGDPVTIAALQLVMLTAARPGEVRGARWAELDLEAALWIIPAERMKMRTEHRIPLSSQAVEVFRSMQPINGQRDLVFASPSYPSKSLSENTLNSAIRRMGFAATAHGFRSLFSTVANECGWDVDVIERQLAHAERNEVRAAYNRSTYLAERTKLMQWWADYLDGQKTGAKVTPLHSSRHNRHINSRAA
jgi:integrase